MTASKESLQSLHDAVADALVEGIKPYTDKDGNTVRNASMINVARQFLKDNDIQARPTKGKPLGALAESFPFEAELAPLDAHMKYK